MNFINARWFLHLIIWRIIIKGFGYCYDKSISRIELFGGPLHFQNRNFYLYMYFCWVFFFVSIHHNTQCSSALNGWWKNKTWYYKITGNYLINLLNFKQKSNCLLDWRILFKKKQPFWERFNLNKSTSNVISGVGIIVWLIFFYLFHPKVWYLNCSISLKLRNFSIEILENLRYLTSPRLALFQTLLHKLAI